MYNYALMLQNGKGGPQNLEGAREWYERAAKEGQINATFSYAAMLENGEGGPKKLEEARKWYKEARSESGLEELLMKVI